MRNKLLIAAAVVVVLASVAYAAFSQIININGTGTTSGDWKVKITGISQSSANGATDASAPTLATLQQRSMSTWPTQARQQRMMLLSKIPEQLTRRFLALQELTRLTPQLLLTLLTP